MDNQRTTAWHTIPRRPALEVADELRAVVAPWFAPEALDSATGLGEGETARRARDLLAEGDHDGAALALLAYRACGNGLREGNEVRAPAIAAECLSRAASLHDQAGDERQRGGTRNRAIRINVGDLLIGEAYQLICRSDLSEQAKLRMVRAISSDRAAGVERRPVEEPLKEFLSAGSFEVLSRACRSALLLGAAARGESRPGAVLDRCRRLLGSPSQ